MEPLAPLTAIDWVVDRFIATGNGATVSEIAKGLGTTEGRVRVALSWDNYKAWDVALSRDEETRPSYSTDYPAFRAGSHKVVVYSPTRAELARRLRAADPNGTWAAHVVPKA